MIKPSGIVAVLVAGLCTAAQARTEQCQPTTQSEIAALFEGWNAALATGQAGNVVARYAPTSILLPTVSNVPRLTTESRRDYFEMFLKSKPQGVIDSRLIQIGCNTAIDAGIYTLRSPSGTVAR